MDALALSIFNNPWFMISVLIWSLPWKAVALWKASKNNHRKWFGAMLVLNTLAVLEIIYIFFFSKRKKTE